MKPRGSVYDTGRHIAHRGDVGAAVSLCSMRALTSIILVSLLAAPLAGCLVRTGHHHHNNGNASARRGGNCGPAYHWNGYKCVHNGNGNGNGNGRGNGHRR